MLLEKEQVRRRKGGGVTHSPARILSNGISRVREHILMHGCSSPVPALLKSCHRLLIGDRAQLVPLWAAGCEDANVVWGVVVLNQTF